MIIPPDFIIIPYEILNDADVEPADRIVYGIVYWLEHLRNGKCTASNETIAELALVSPRSAANSLRRLEHSGYIERTYKDAGKRNRLEIRSTIAFRFVSKDSKRRGNDTSNDESRYIVRPNAIHQTMNRRRKNNKKKEEEQRGIPETINKDSWKEWLGYRKDIGKKMTDRTITLQHNLLAKYSKHDQKRIIEKSIQNGWTGLFELQGSKGAAVVVSPDKKYENL